MRIGVTGGNGFIGSYVVDELLRRGDDVLILDHTSKRSPQVAGLEVFLGDVRDATAMTEFAAHVDGIVHLAAVLGTQETIGNPRPAAETNVQGSLNVFEAAVQYDLPLVYIAVGNHFMRSQGGGTYTITKTCVEDFVRMFNKHRGARFNVVRAMNAYGPRQVAAVPFGPAKVRKIMPSFVCRALCGMDVEIYGDGEQVSDMVWVGDVAHALCMALDVAAIGVVLDDVVEVGPNLSCTVNQVARLVIDEVQIQTDGTDSRIVHLPMRPGETPGATVSADVSTMSQIGMSCLDLVPLGEGIRRTVAAFIESEGDRWVRP